MSDPSTYSRRRAFTLPEVLLASAILAFAVAAFAQALLSGQAHVYAGVNEARAVSILEATMAEVIRLPYADPEDGAAYNPGPEAGEADRSGFDNLDDYHGWEQTYGSFTDLAGTPYPASHDGFIRAVSVFPETAYVRVFGQDFNGARVVVKLADLQGQVWTLEQFVPEPQP